MTITTERFIQSDIEWVWRAWTESERIVEWFAPSAEIEPWVNGKFELYFNPGNRDTMSTRGCKISRFEQPSSLTFEWKGPDPFAEAMNQDGELTSVDVELEPADGGTVIRLRHSGWKETQEALLAKQWHVQAWEQMLDSLKNSIESGKGILCCQ